MSQQRCYLELLPVEILHMVFDYLAAYQIFDGFLNISSYLEGVVTSYQRYQLNFQSIVKNQYDFVCRHIKPDGLASLILSDGVDTPFQSNLFLSFFELEQFYGTLRALSLVDVNEQSMQAIMRHIQRFVRLTSFAVTCNESSVPANLIHVFPQLIDCHIPREWFFRNFIPMPQLKHLIISNRCTYEQFVTIIDHCPKLISLNITLEGEIRQEHDLLVSDLSKLIINMTVCYIGINQLKRILIAFPKLIFCEIEARTDLDSCDGHHWESFICTSLSRLKTFNFKFQLKPTITLNTIGIQTILSSFSSTFWLIQKVWYIAIEWEQRLVYSVPRYSCESADPNFRPPSHCTSVDKTIFYDHVTALAVWKQPMHRFAYIEELWLLDNPIRIDLTTLIDIDRVRRLVVVASKIDMSLEGLIDFTRCIKNLVFIQFFDIPLNSVENTESITAITQIRSLELSRECQSLSYFEVFQKSFPCLERLRMKVQSEEELRYVLKIPWAKLSIVYFDCGSFKISISREWIEQVIGHNNFTFAIDQTSIRLWKGSEKSTDRIESIEKKVPGCFLNCFNRRRPLKH